MSNNESQSNKMVIISSNLKELDILVDKLVKLNYNIIVDDRYMVLDNGDFATVITNKESDG